MQKASRQSGRAGLVIDMATFGRLRNASGLNKKQETASTLLFFSMQLRQCSRSGRTHGIGGNIVQRIYRRPKHLLYGNHKAAGTWL
jgi:hypothetical protein